MIQFSKILVTDGQTDGQTDESDFIGCCPTNVECPKGFCKVYNDENDYDNIANSAASLVRLFI